MMLIYLNAIEIYLLDLLPYPTPPGHNAFCPLQLHSQPGRCISQHPQSVLVGSAGHALLKRNTQTNKQTNKINVYTVYIIFSFSRHWFVSMVAN